MRRYGRKPRPVLDRFWEKVLVTDQCWWWMPRPIGSGYGRFVIRYHIEELAHRFSYQLARGPIPDGLFVCHHCDNPRCVNPAHLFVGTALDNNRDCVRKGRNYQARPYCKRGHRMDGDNILWARKTGKRQCRSCCAMRGRIYKERRRNTATAA